MVLLRKGSIAAEVKAALALLTLLTALGSLGLLFLARRAARDAGEVYRNSLEPMQRLMEVSEAYTVDITLALRGVRGGRMDPVRGRAILVESRTRARAAWEGYKPHRPATPALEATEMRLTGLEALSQQLDGLLPLGVSRELGSFGDARWLPEVAELSHELQGLRDEESREARILIASLQARSRHTLVLGLALLTAVLGLTLGFGHAVTRRIQSGVHALVDHLRRVADGHLEPFPVDPEGGELAMAERELNRTVERISGLMADLRGRQAREQAILDAAPAAIVGLDLSGTVTHFNLTAQRMLGYTEAEVVGKATPLLWRLPGELRSLAREMSERLGRPVQPGIEALQSAASLPDYATECHYLAKDGTRIPVVLSPTQVRDPEGTLLGTMSVALDLRGVEMLRRELRASETRYRDLVERLPDVVYQARVDREGRRTWTFLSPQFEQLYGVGAAVLDRDPDYALHKIHPEDREDYVRALTASQVDRTPLTWEGRSYTERPGELKWIRVRRVPSIQPDGSVLWDGLLEDITKLKLSEEALRLSEARAQEASRAKTAFLASVSHELRTPLSAILGYTRLMAKDPWRSEDDRTQLEQVLKAGEHLLALINDVLSLSKIESGRMEVHAVAFRPADLLRELESLFRLSALSKGLDFRLDAPDLPAQVSGDLPKLRQVLVNLLGNALKFTAQGHVRLAASWRGSMASFEVQDTGPGIAPEELATLFQPFQQTATGLAAGGTGLGLHISQALVALMGGRIRCQSRPGEGTRFVFEVDLAPCEPTIQPNVQLGEVLHLPPDRSPRLLIVDDRPDNRDILQRLLGRLGFVCLQAEDGAQAVERWAAQTPDLVLMDLRMPVVDGFEAVRRMRERESLEGLRRTPVAAVSASVYDVTQEDLLARGFDAFLIKPIQEDRLFATLEQLLDLHFERVPRAAPGTARASVLPRLAHQDEGWKARFLDAVASGDLEAAEGLLPELADGRLVEEVRVALRAYRVEDILQHLH